MGQEISWEIRQQAEELYIFDGRTYHDIASRTGVSETQLKRWGMAGQWGQAKKEHRTALANIRRQKVLLRQGLVERAMNSLDPQDVYAFARLETVTASKTTTKEAPAESITVADLKAKTPTQIISALEDLTVAKLNQMTLQPGAISLAGIKEMKNALDLIGKMKTEYAQETADRGAPKGLSNEVVQDIQKKILGI